MFSGHVAARIAVMHVPDIAADVLLQNHDVSRSNRRHARRRGGAREMAPIAGEIQLGNNSTKAEQRGFAPTECVRASRRATADRSFVALMIGDERHHGAKLLMTIMVRVGFGGNGKKQQTRYRKNNFQHQGRTP